MRYFWLLFLFVSTLFGIEAINGKPVLLPIEQNTTSVKARNHFAPIFKTQNGEHFALIAIPYRQDEPLEVTLKGPQIDLKTSLHVTKGEYPKELLQVDPSKISPPESEKKRISDEYKEAMGIYATFTPKRYWDKPFAHPIQSTITSAYGNARTFNGTLKSYHSGTDFRAPIGTPIYAANDGVIVLAKDRYYAGGSVIIDHGEGIYSVYYHLSSMLLPVGTQVKRSDEIALSGDSGRVTGPHLHFGIMLQGTPVDPLHFIQIIEDIIN
jgi:murein DD-endopeptidase MepM/ murein hydrolase activator NlpD